MEDAQNCDGKGSESPYFKPSDFSPAGLKPEDSDSARILSFRARLFKVIDDFVANDPDSMLDGDVSSEMGAMLLSYSAGVLISRLSNCVIRGMKADMPELTDASLLKIKGKTVDRASRAHNAASYAAGIVMGVEAEQVMKGKDCGMFGTVCRALQGDLNLSPDVKAMLEEAVKMACDGVMPTVPQINSPATSKSSKPAPLPKEKVDDAIAKALEAFKGSGGGGGETFKKRF